MDAKKRCLEIIEQFPEEQLSNLATSLEAMLKMIDAALDDAYCLGLYRESMSEGNADPMPFEEFAKELGLEKQ